MPTVLTKQGLYFAQTVQTQGGGAHLVFVIGDELAYRSNAYRRIALSFTKA
ncbi:MAG: hypothetical protein R1F54_10545 [Candidatus Zeuxoniibacter abyssi]|nr:MAG: hypothetical protein R1F54_10545 [Candidatus Persebacteraceae bacterium AB1(2)]